MVGQGSDTWCLEHGVQDPSTPKADAEQITELLENEAVHKFYHFTDRRNLALIRQHGLCSWQLLEKLHIPQPASGGNNSSREKDLLHDIGNFVRLSFCNEHPMKGACVGDGRITDCVVLEISTTVATWHGTMFSDSNTAHPDCRKGPRLHDLERVKFNVVRLPTQSRIKHEDQKRFYQAEVMVPSRVPPALITFPDSDTQGSSQSLPGSSPVPKSVRFTGDQWRYHKECAYLYPDPCESFFQELLQNSLDACARVEGAPMKIECSVADVTISNKTRVQVIFKDNGCGMDMDTVQQGLLKVGSTSDSRTDYGRKKALRDCAGGFGLAKTLLFLGQDEFEIHSKTAEDEEGVYIMGRFGRQDQEEAETDSLRGRQRHHRLDSGFTLQHGEHGTWIRIVLNPWVMVVHGRRAPQIRVVDKSPWPARDYRCIARRIYGLCRLPVEFHLDGEKLRFDCELGTKVCDIRAPTQWGSQSRIGCLYEKPYKNCVEYSVVLQVLPGRAQGHAKSDYFLHCFDGNSCVPNINKLLTLFLFTCDENGRNFKVGEMLSGTRSRLSQHVQLAVDNALQRYYVDPNLVKPPPESLKPLVPGQQSFSEWFSTECRQKSVQHDPSFWTEMAHDTPTTRQRANTYLGNKSWRSRITYMLWLFKEEGIGPDTVPSEFRDVNSLKTHDIMWLELYGAYVYSALEACALIPDSKVYAGKKFHVGFIITKDEDRMYCPNPGLMTNGSSDIALLYPWFEKRPAEDCTDFKTLKRAVYSLRAAAIHQVAHLKVKMHQKPFIQQIEVLTEAMAEVEEKSNQSWFHNYRRKLADRIMRDGQEGRAVPALVRHMAAIEAASIFQHDSTATASAMQAEVENVRRMMSDAFGSRDLTGREERIPLEELMKTYAKENQELRQKINRMSQYKTRLCRMYAHGGCRKGSECCFAHGDWELRGSVPVW